MVVMGEELMFHERVRLAVLAAPLLLAMAGCSGTESSDASDSPTNSPSEVECLQVDEAMMEGVATGAIAGTGLDPVRAAAVRSPDFEKVFFIAMEFSATGIPDQVGVWASNSLEPGGGSILAVNAVAQEFTDWPAADSTDAAIGLADPSVFTAISCLEADQ